MKEKISIKPKIMEMNNTNNIYMTLNICILSNDVNYNNAQFLDDFIDGVIDNKETYIGIPFLVNRQKLESADYESLSHELKDGELLTDQIGSFVDFWKEEIDDANCLMGSIKIMKRFPNTCNAVVELHAEGLLETSCEVLISSYKEISDSGVRQIHYAEGANALIGSAIVYQGAEKRAKPTLLVAEAYKKDTQSEEVKTLTEEKFNKGYDTKYHGQFEVASLKYDEIHNQIYNKLNPLNAKSNNRNHNYYIRDMFNDHVIIEDWHDDSLYKVTYTITNDEVILPSQDEWQAGKLGFIPDNNVEVASLLSEKETELSELQTQLQNAKEELETMAKEKSQEVLDLEKEILDLKAKIKELSETVVSQEEAKKELSEQVDGLTVTVTELEPFKLQVEKAEKDAKIAELSAKYSRILPDETFKSERVQGAIQNLNSVELNSVVFEEISKEKTVEVSSTKTDDTVTIVASKQEDLIEKNILQKYEIQA